MTDKITTPDNRAYWDNFYKNNRNYSESTFCNEIRQKFQQDTIVVDIGCGSGRDSFSFAANGFEVFGIDGSHEAIAANTERAKELNYNGEVIFSKADLSDGIALREIFSTVLTRSEQGKKKIVLYLRFLLHAIDDQTQQVLLDAIAECLPIGTTFVAEFRSAEDAERSEVYDDHYRRFIETDKLLVELMNRGFSIKEFYKGTGLSIYKDEDPFLARVLAEKLPFSRIL